ncbi:MAG: MobA-like NTP transferase domain containing protein, partial [Nitrospirae bacterium]
YGAIEIEDGRVKRIIEWKYWKDYPSEKQRELEIFNAGIYTFKRDSLIKYIELLKRHPHIVEKEVGGKKELIEEFFITDLVELMNGDGLKVGCIVVEDEREVMGVDTPSSLHLVQKFYEEFRREKR